MATYYINAKSDDPVSPYTGGVDTGAHSFNDLFSDESVVFADDDIIEVYRPSNSSDYDVDDSATSTIIIDRNITIRSHVPANAADTVPPFKAVVIMPNGHPLFRFTSRVSKGLVKYIKFLTPLKGAGAAILLQSAINVSISNCEFTFNAMDSVAVDEFSTWIHAQNVVGMSVDSCSFINPSNQLDAVYIGSSVYIEVSYDSSIKNNAFYFMAGVSQGVYCKQSSNVRISRNTFNSFVNTIYSNINGDYFRAISVTFCDTVDISENYITGLVKNYCGIYVYCADNVDANVMIRNNEVYVNQSGNTNTACIVARVLKFIQIINNYLASIPVIGHPEYVNSTTIAFDVRITKGQGVIDYNNITNMTQEIVNGGNVTLINSVGIHTTRELSMELAVGRGTEFTNIGRDFRRIEHSAPMSYYFSVVDTVLHTDNNGMSRISTIRDSSPLAWNEHLGTYINDALVMTSSTAYSSSGTYMNLLSDDSYQNQFEWNYIETDPFPFTKYSKFYKKNSDYVYQNRKSLWPFTNVSCPANPGNGYIDGYSGDSYINGKVGYETGLFGYSRALWENGCGTPCIIQDTYRDVAKQYNSNIEADKVLYNVIHPACEGN